MRDRLAAVFNALRTVETKGESTIIMSDCLRELLAVIQQMDEDNRKEDNN